MRALQDPLRGYIFGVLFLVSALEYSTHPQAAANNRAKTKRSYIDKSFYKLKSPPGALGASNFGNVCGLGTALCAFRKVPLGCHPSPLVF